MWKKETLPWINLLITTILLWKCRPTLEEIALHMALYVHKFLIPTVDKANHIESFTHTQPPAYHKFLFEFSFNEFWLLWTKEKKYKEPLILCKQSVFGVSGLVQAINLALELMFSVCVINKFLGSIQVGVVWTRES